MSEKVGSGDNSSQLLEQEQVLLDWQDLPSYGLLKRSTEDDAKTENETKAGDAAELGQNNRLTAQARGERLLRAVAESLPDAVVDSASNSILEQRDTVDGDDVDTLTLRAEQAMGREQFVGLVDTLLEASYTEEPDKVMQKFREEAQKIGSIEAGDLWGAVLHNAKLERFGEKLADVKFYYSTSFEDLGEILKSGRLVRKDEEGSALKSDLKFSCDHTENEEWKSGFADERGAKSQDVTMVFDARLLLEDGFVALGKNPSASEANWKASCLGLVIGDRDKLPTLRRVTNEHGGGELPVYYSEDWAERVFSPSDLRETRDEYAKQVERKKELTDDLYNLRALELIAGQVSEVEDNIHDDDLAQMYERHHNTETVIEQHQADEEIVGYLKAIYEINRRIDIKYYRDETSTRIARYDKDGILELNEFRTEAMHLDERMGTLGHEVRHVYQEGCAERHIMDVPGRSDEQKKYDELCFYNLKNYISDDCDPIGYLTQFVEFEATLMDATVRKKYREVEKKMKQPSERARRMARKIGGKITAARAEVTGGE